MKSTSIPTKFLSILLLLCAFFGFSLSALAAATASVTLTKENSHKIFETTIQEMLKTRSSTDEIIKKNDLPALRVKLKELESSVKLVQASMDKALLVGAWRTREIKGTAHVLADRVETLRILNFIGLAFTSDFYAHPTGKVSNSVKDSIARFYGQLESIGAQAVQLNAKAQS